MYTTINSKFTLLLCTFFYWNTEPHNRTVKIQVVGLVSLDSTFYKGEKNYVVSEIVKA